METSRRHLLKSAVIVGGATVMLSGASLERRRAAAEPLRRTPFSLGVASGDPWPDGFVLWTRLAPDPLAEDGLGGMPARDVELAWEVAYDVRFSQIARRGTTIARTAGAHTVHVELFGLAPDRPYFYRFRYAGHLSPVGRTHTAPPADANPASLTLAVASCANYEHGWFTAYRDLADRPPDLVVFLGDYLYEYDELGWVERGGNLRHHLGPEATDLASYRRRHAQYKTDPDLQAAHASAPWVVVPDDHEVDDNWAASTAQELGGSQPDFPTRRAAALQAYYEHLPLRRSCQPRAGRARLHRRLAWGRLANLHLLDTRQYRDDQACGDELRTGCQAADWPARTMLGDAQETWLMDGFARSTARWDLIGQQVPVAEIDHDPGPDKALWMDEWDGYSAARRRLLEGMVRHEVRNPVVLTGDLHRHSAADLRLDPADPATPVVASELICTSITSGGDGWDDPPARQNWPRWNPDLKFVNNQRGYVRVRMTPDSLTADFRVVDRVSVKGRPVRDRATYELLDGERGWVERVGALV